LEAKKGLALPAYFLVVGQGHTKGLGVVPLGYLSKLSK